MPVEIRRITRSFRASDRAGFHPGPGWEDPLIVESEDMAVERLPDGRYRILGPALRKAIKTAAAAVASDLQNLRDAVEFTAAYDFDISVATTHNVITLAVPAGKTKYFVNRLVVECKTQGAGAASNASIVLKVSGGGNVFNTQTVPAAAQAAGQYVRISNTGAAVATIVNGDVIQLQVSVASTRNSIMTLYMIGTFV